MHRRLTFQGRAEVVRALAREVAGIEGVIGVGHFPGASLKPPGDFLQMDVLNRSVDEVLRRARRDLEKPGVLTLVVSQTSAAVDRSQATLIHSDADEATWEEMESDLRNHGRIGVNYLVLMGLGGAIAAAGLRTPPVSQAIALVGASIVSPGFEPIAKLAQGLVLGAPKLCVRAGASIVIGYLVLLGAALLTTLLLSAVSPQPPTEAFLDRATAHDLAGVHAASVVASACAAVAGIMMVVSLRDLYVVGPLMILVLISGTALAGAAFANGEGRRALAALGRVGIDMGMIVVLGAAVFFWKQRAFHRRRPLS